MSATAVLLDAPAGSDCDAGADRRTHARVQPHDLAWIREVRIKHGPRVSLLDLSPGGALLQTDVQLRPGTDLALEIIGSSTETVLLRVLRCQIARIAEAGAIYRGACQFKRPLDLARRPAVPVRSDLALKQLLARRRRSLAAAAGFQSDRDLPNLLRSFQAASHAGDPLGRGVADLLSELVPALDRGEPPAVLKGRLEERLRRALPHLTLAVASAPLEPRGHGVESLYFAADGQPGPGGVLNVELASGTQISDWQFRLLQASSYLLELLPAGPLDAPTLAATPEACASREGAILEPAADAGLGWQKIVVRYKEGRLLKGFTHDFHPSRNQFSLWPSINAAPSERVHIPASQLKAVFFVRDFNGNPGRHDERAFDQTAAGRRLEVTFTDDEVLVGSTLSYRPDGLGFFVNPGDRGANNLRVFVVSSAIRHVRFP